MKVVLIILGFISMGIGIIGIVAPILPTTPFLLLASFFFAKAQKDFTIGLSLQKFTKNIWRVFFSQKL